MALAKQGLTLVSLLLVGLAMGCSRPVAQDTPPHRRGTPRVWISNEAKNNFTARLHAADSIVSINAADQAYQQIALDAASAGHPDIVKKSLEGIVSISRRDQTAFDAVVRLVRAGNSAGAAEIVDKICSISLRDRAWKFLAMGE